MKSNNEIIEAIEAKYIDLTDEEKQTVNELLDFHSQEPSAAAERISEYLSEVGPIGVTKDFIYDLL